MYSAGWFGLVMLIVAPSLRTGFYIGLCLILITLGIFEAIFLARRLSDPTLVVLNKTNAVLRDILSTDTTPERDESTTERSSKIPNQSD